ncbi:MAG: hypothetical protein CMN01_06240 [Rickettsiales bacterium]|nr:hypothetical protein [Rickettsiales bacterium]|tara:strand:- start:80 stop:622 length:543 start_codon:yes stop_codon:yes gene_type:complete
MILFFSISFLIVLFYSLRIFEIRRKKKFFASLSLLTFLTVLIYLFKGSLESFTFEEKLKNQITQSLQKGGLESLNSSNLILFLENQLKTEPLDSEGWLILARTCMISGYHQKAELYYKKGLNYFPKNVEIMYEYSNLKRKSGRLEEAIVLIDKIIEISPNSNVFKEKKQKLLVELEFLKK